MAKRMALVLGVVVVLLSALGFVKYRQVETAVRQTAALVRHTLELNQKVAVVAGPVVAEPVVA